MEKEDKGYELYTSELKIISDYCKLNFYEISDLCFDEYKLLFRDAYIYLLQKSEKGSQYLEDAYYLEQTEPDRKTLREKLNKRGDE